jgi:hypothetical protein
MDVVSKRQRRAGGPSGTLPLRVMFERWCGVTNSGVAFSTLGAEGVLE